MAENDYRFLKYNYDAGIVGNAMGYISQNICERFLKHAIDTYCRNIDMACILRTHSLKAICNFMRENMPDFECRWNEVIKADGYYFTARCPGEDSFIVTQSDVQECWEAVSETRDCVLRYIREQEVGEGDRPMPIGCNLTSENP